MEILILLLVIVLGLIMIPFGLPGTWIIAAGALGYSLLVPGSISIVSVVIIVVLALIGELLEFSLTAKYTRKYGGSRRASWGAIIGGMIGAFLGVPVPVIGSVIGAFAGAFVGAFVFEYSRAAQHGTAVRVAWGALVGRVIAATMKVGIGLAMGAWLVFASFT